MTYQPISETPELVRQILAIQLPDVDVPEAQVDRILALSACKKSSALSDTIADWLKTDAPAYRGTRS